ncbi:uncharacterized protein LOC119670827 [Teleopsis dalmanni]|uniref:uncharacterized protein LOC119670678 n=1 Tax=Teleopsis dalmanni TaxID=139649 RepID=UPI0018CCB9B8|nr:uncharacterized protein LOC119670678 [Teleopsis dalmanni]XP_037937176.1 uncharacterized protein LOC119670827 [Teleopsis dalmanni]
MLKPITPAEENRNYLRAFIQTYRNLPILWDTSLRDYTNRDKRAEAYEQLVPIYRYLKRDATVEDVKKKINTLRTNYRKELKVVECSRRTGLLHTPRCWTYPELDFLRNTEKFLAVNPNYKNESFAFSENSQSQNGFLDASNYSPSIAEMFQKSFGNAKPEAQVAAASPTSTGAPHIVVDYHQQQQNNTQPDSVKRQRLSPHSHTSTPNGHSADEMHMINMACDYLSGTFPEEESIARTWTHKLKRLQRPQRLLAEKFINDILFEAESGTLHRGSIHINGYEPYVRYEQQQADEHIKSQSPSIHTSCTNTAAASPETEPKTLSSSDTTPNNFGGYKINGM